MSIIELDNVSFSHTEAARALDGVSLRVSPGDFICLIGSNGSGKTTLAKHLNALLVPDGGAVRVLGRDTADPASMYFVRSNVGMVFQNPDDQIVASVVEDDVAFGPENLGVPAAELRGRVTEALAAAGLAGFETRPVDELSGGEKQRVAIAGALAMKPQVLVLDEATAMLDPEGRAEVMRVCRELNADGTTIIMITHFMDEAAQADRVIALDAGRVVLDGPPDEALAQESRLEAIGIEAPLSRGAAVLPAPPRMAGGDAPAAVEFAGVSFSYRDGGAPALAGMSFALREGEALGVAGRTGSGKSTLLQLASGLLRPTAGAVRVMGRDLAGRRAASAVHRDVGMAFQYPERQLFAATVFEDVAFGPRNQGLSEGEVECRVREALDMVQLDFGKMRDRSPFALSGGEQRRVALAGILAMRTPILALDEPTAGLDPRGRRALVELLGELRRERNLTLVVASHDLDCLSALCDCLLEL